MKAIISLMLLLFSFNFICVAQQWSWVIPYPSGEKINQCYFLDEQRGFAIGISGTLIRTTDGGTKWNQVVTSKDANLIKILFYDNYHGWILGSKTDLYYNTVPYFLRTTDGGINWESQTITSFNVNLSDFFFLNMNLGWCIGNDGKLFKTTDGGLSWIDKSFQQMNSAYFNSIIFRNESEGFVFGYSQYPNRFFIIGYSTNGGNNWVFKYSPFNLDGLQLNTEATLDSIFINTAMNGMILRSTDKGNSWSFSMDNPLEMLYSIDFLNTGLGIAGADSGRFLKSSDGGINWTKNNTGFSTSLKSVQCVDENFFTASGYIDTYPSTYPYILISTDAGTTWNNNTRILSNPISIVGADVVDTQNVFICGNTENYGDAYIYRSSDGGVNWQQSYFSNIVDLYDISSFNSSLIFACGQKRYAFEGLVLKSIDSGQSWSSHNISSGYPIYEISIPDSSAMYAFTESKMYKSTDVGDTWDIIYQSSYPIFRDIEFVSENVGFVLSGLSYSSSIYKTTDGGTNWDIFSISSNSEVYSMSFPSENVGYACGFYNLFKTNNGGINWVQLNNIANANSFSEVVFNDELNGWIIGNNGIYYTSDGGQSWTQEFNSEYSFNTFAIKKSESLYAAGGGCRLIKYNADLASAVVLDQKSTLPIEFALLQNYPNPFNPITKIRYDIATASQVTLKIYDILGEEVITLVNELVQPGRYTVDWNAGSFASGVYLYTITAGDFIETKKMILIR